MLHVCVCFMRLITTPVFCARSHDLVMSVSVRRVQVVSRLLEPCHKTRETATLRRGALRRVRTQAIGARTPSFFPRNYSSAQK